MRIKEVIAETELTDRAIRLYIDEKLVSPSFSENYKGRKSYDFSADDVEALKNIAVLRKSGFSIAEIKALKNNALRKNTLEKFTAQKEKEIKDDRAICKILRRILKETEISIDSICSALNEADVGSGMPKELQQQTEDSKFITIALVSFALWLLMIIYEISDIIRVYSPPYHIDRNGITYTHFIIHLTACLVPATIFLLNRFPPKKDERKKLSKSVSSILAVMLLPVLFVSFWNTLLSPLVPIVYSYTTNIKYYSETHHHRLFPEYIPYNATDIKYLHRYRNAIDSDRDTVAEWSLPYNEYEEAKSFAINYTGEITHKTEKGEWVCVYFEDYDESKEFIDFKGYYSYTVFAYNDSTGTVRYIESSSMWSSEPYYFSLNW